MFCTTDPSLRSVALFVSNMTCNKTVAVVCRCDQRLACMKLLKQLWDKSLTELSISFLINEVHQPKCHMQAIFFSQ